jgi:IS605 OrfB family transposase
MEATLTAFAAACNRIAVVARPIHSTNQVKIQHARGSRTDQGPGRSWRGPGGSRISPRPMTGRRSPALLSKPVAASMPASVGRANDGNQECQAKAASRPHEGTEVSSRPESRHQQAAGRQGQGIASAIGVEDLADITTRTTVNRVQRGRLEGWAFHQLWRFIAYKAALAGIPVIAVDPRNTSRICSECGHCEKRNRKSRDEFECRHCGFACGADKNAARNIRLQAMPYWAEVMRPDALNR